MEENQILQRLRAKLEELQYPSQYLFKFIFPMNELENVKALFSTNQNFILKPSAGGKYLSLTCNTLVNSADEIMEVYIKASEIEGIISL